MVEDALRALAAHVPSRKEPPTIGDRGVGRDGATAKTRVRRQPAAMDDEDAFVLAKFPSVGHGAMDADHAEIERLMRRALDTCAARDVQSLTDAFRDHAAEEETLLREAEDANVGEDGVDANAPASFRASASHAADHERVLAEFRAIVSSVGPEKTVEKKILHRACRAVVEHAVTYDAAYAGKLKA